MKRLSSLTIFQINFQSLASTFHETIQFLPPHHKSQTASLESSLRIPRCLLIRMVFQGRTSILQTKEKRFHFFQYFQLQQIQALHVSLQYQENLCNFKLLHSKEPVRPSLNCHQLDSLLKIQTISFTIPILKKINTKRRNNQISFKSRRSKCKRSNNKRTSE